jgi:hypothetical protein
MNIEVHYDVPIVYFMKKFHRIYPQFVPNLIRISSVQFKKKKFRQKQ